MLQYDAKRLDANGNYTLGTEDKSDFTRQGELDALDALETEMIDTKRQQEIIENNRQDAVLEQLGFGDTLKMQPIPEQSELSEPVTPLVRDVFNSLLRKREQKGIETYGETLYTFNGRDAGRDLVEELVDTLQYAVQQRTEHLVLLRAFEKQDQWLRIFQETDLSAVMEGDRNGITYAFSFLCKVAEAAKAYMEQIGANNYVTFDLPIVEGDTKKRAITIQMHEGVTPAERQAQLEKENSDLEKEIATLRQSLMEAGELQGRAVATIEGLEGRLQRTIDNLPTP